MTTPAEIQGLAVADPTAALCAFLSAQPQVAGLLGKNRFGEPAVFRPQVPEAEDQNMPQAAIAVRRNGGMTLFQGSYLPVSDPKIDFTCYGATVTQAQQVATAVVAVLKQLRMGTWENTMLYWAKPTGPIPLADTETLFPASVVTAQVMCADYQNKPEV